LHSNVYGLSQNEFGEKIGITRGSINSYENNVNPLTQGAKWKILQATGIGYEYFDTNMSLAEALVKYKIDISKGLKIQPVQESICAIYEHINDFLTGKCVEYPFNIKTWILNQLFSEIKNYDICFVKVKQNELEPYAKKGEILIVVRDENCQNGDEIIIEFKGNILVVKYFSEFDTIRLELMSGKEQHFSLNEF